MDIFDRNPVLSQQHDELHTVVQGLQDRQLDAAPLVNRSLAFFTKLLRYMQPRSDCRTPFISISAAASFKYM